MCHTLNLIVMLLFQNSLQYYFCSDVGHNDDSICKIILPVYNNHSGIHTYD